MKDTRNLLQTSAVYAFHIPSINAIKVGFGGDGMARMKNYSRQYALSASATSLRQWKIPSSIIAASIETACHNALLQAEFFRVVHTVDEREAKELFDLGDHSYDQAVLVVAEAIEETISALHEALGTFKPLSQEKARQQKEDAQRKRDAIRDEKRKAKHDEQDRLVTAAAHEIQQRWERDAIPAETLWDAAAKMYKSFNSNYQGTWDWIVHGKQSTATRIRRWEQWSSLKNLIPALFAAIRLRKGFYLDMNLKHQRDILKQAEKRLGLEICGYRMPFVNKYDVGNLGFLEVRYAVQTATGFSGEDAEELIKGDPDLMNLVAFADQNPPPEIERGFR